MAWAASSSAFFSSAGASFLTTGPGNPRMPAIGWWDPYGPDLKPGCPYAG